MYDGIYIDVDIHNDASLLKLLVKGVKTLPEWKVCSNVTFTIYRYYRFDLESRNFMWWCDDKCDCGTSQSITNPDQVREIIEFIRLNGHLFLDVVVPLPSRIKLDMSKIKEYLKMYDSNSDGNRFTFETPVNKEYDDIILPYNNKISYYYNNGPYVHSYHGKGKLLI